jgi:protein-L-isoaspartate(D-aspartate) O-methyltransferase
MVEQIQAWDRQARSDGTLTFAYWPTGIDRTQISEGTAVLEKTHGLVTISWAHSTSSVTAG